MKNTVLLDQYNRNLNYLRISITDRCNLNCTYCAPDRLVPKLTHTDILRYEEILRLVRISVDLGITKVRITGGEPLVRTGVYGFLEKLAGVQGLCDISLTTNGVLLKDNLQSLKSIGIRRINISLDTLNRLVYKKITGHDSFNQVWEGILGAIETGFSPIKINAVALPGINENEIVDLARLSFTLPLHIRFIEYMPIGNPIISTDKNTLLAPEIKNRISMLGNIIKIVNGDNDGPSQRFKFEGSQGEIGIISPISQHFCETCNRLRLTANGQLRTCLLSDYQEDLKGPMRAGASDDELADIIIKAVRNKPKRHQLACSTASGICSQMSSIGG